VSETQSFKLIIEDDEGRRSIVPVDLGNVSIGRLENNTIRLNERNVSRQHARFLKENGAVFAEDLGSYNGVFINGDRIKGRHEVREGDLIKIGDFHLELRGEGLLRRTEETTQRTLLADREDTQTDVRIVDPEPTAMTQVPTLPGISNLLRREGAGKQDSDDEVERHEATAIIRLDSPELQAGHKQAAIAGDKAKLICVSPQLAGREYELTKTEVTIGRTDENDIAIDHRSVSRHHARVQVVAGRYRLVDLKSANGTLVNGEQYAQAELKRGDMVELGHVKFRFVPPGETYTLNADEAALVKTRKASPAAALTEEENSAVSSPLRRLGAMPLLPIGIGVVLVVGAVLLVILATSGTEPTPAVVPDIATPPTGQAPAPVGEGHSLISRAQTAFSQRRWQQAATLAGAALEIEPTSQVARDVAQQAQVELKAQASYEAATSAISRSDWSAAWRSLGELPETSIYKAQSVGLVEQVKSALMADLLARGRAAIDNEEFDRAASMAEEAQRIDAGRSEATQLRTDVERARAGARNGGRPRKEAQPRTLPRKDVAARPPPVTVVTTPTPPPPPASTGKDANALYTDGIAALKGGDLQSAINTFDECTKADPTFAKCYRALGIAYAKSGNGAKAARYYKQYLKVSPNAADAEQVRGLLEQYETAP
jgi:ABC transport system ATP-binding/permease protein